MRTANKSKDCKKRFGIDYLGNEKVLDVWLNARSHVGG